MANCLKCGTYMGDNTNGSIYCSRCTLNGVAEGLGEIANSSAGPAVIASILTLFITICVLVVSANCLALLFGNWGEGNPPGVLAWILTSLYSGYFMYRPVLRFVKRISY